MRGRPGAALAVAAVAAAVCAIASCLAPTETKVELSTDLCSNHPRTAIYLNAPTDTIDPTAPATVTSQCDPDGTIGSIVVVPRRADAPFQIDAITALDDVDPATCYAAPARCVFSRRRLPESLPHTPIDLPIEQLLACLGIECDPASTCYRGGCVPNTVDPSQCATPGGCELSGDGSAPPEASREGSPPEGSVEGSPPEGSPEGSPPEGSPPDAFPDALSPDASSPSEAGQDSTSGVDAAGEGPGIDAGGGLDSTSPPDSGGLDAAGQEGSAPDGSVTLDGGAMVDEGGSPGEGGLSPGDGGVTVDGP